jgi:retron-type reverse transcriptase
LLHHITPQLLAQSFYALRRDAAVDVDGMSWREYEEGLLQRVSDLHARLHSGAYRATPSRRVYIPKADGRQRPLGIASLEDKIVQQAVVRDELKRRRHEPVRAQGQWLTRVVRGYFNYHAVPGNLIRLDGFRAAVCRLWRQALKRRSQRNRLQWSRFGRLADIYIPKPRTAHPYPEERFASRT